MALACRWRSRPQHQKRTLLIATRMSAMCQKQTFKPLFDIIVGGQGCSSSWSITMRLPRRQFLQLVTGAGTLSAAPHVVRAQAYPTRSITIIVPFAPGGGTDVSARVVAEHMSRTLGQQF